MPRKLLLSPRFREELKQQLIWIGKDNPAAADAAEGRVRVALRRLFRFPELGRPGRVVGTCELVVPRTRFIIAYRLNGEVVEIAALRHGRQAWPSDR